MNSKYRILVLLACLILLACVSGIAEEGEIIPDVMAAVEDIPAEANESMPEAVDAPIDLPIIEAEMESPAETAIPSLPELTPPPAEIQIDEIAGVAAGSNYSYGYAKLTMPTTGYASASPDAEAIIYLENGVFFVSDRRASSSSDRLRVHFCDNGETRSLWVDERCLHPMSAVEVLDFVSSCLGKNGVRLYSGNPMLPLDEPSYSSVITYSRPAQEKDQATPAMLVNQMQLALNIGDVLPIGISFSDGKGHAVQFASKDENIASVSEDGRVTGISSGTTHVQVKSEFSNVAMIEILVQE